MLLLVKLAGFRSFKPLRELVRGLGQPVQVVSLILQPRYTGGAMGNIKIVTIEQINEEEDLWRTIHDMLVLSEKIIISKMGDFDELNFKTLSEIRELLNIARHKAYDRWHTVNIAVKHIETGTTETQ